MEIRNHYLTKGLKMMPAEQNHTLKHAVKVLKNLSITAIFSEAFIQEQAFNK